MRPSREKQIAQYKQTKAKKNSVESLISQKRKNLDRMMEEAGSIRIEKENDFSRDNYASEVQRKQRKYMADLDAISEVQFKLIQLRHAHQSLEKEIQSQESNLETWTKNYRGTIAALEESMQQLLAGMEHEKSEKIRMQEERCQHYLDTVEKLTNQKEELINRNEEILKRRQTLELNSKKIKENYQEELRKQKEIWGKGEQEKREKWQAKKLEEITQNTLKGLQPQIQRIVGSSKRQILKIEQKYETLKNEYKKQMNQQYESNMKEIKKQINDRVQEEKIFIIQKSNEQYKKQIDKLVALYEGERMKLRMAKEAELRDLQGKRKKQTEEFMMKDKDYLLSHLNQVKAIKSNYENQIRNLDGSVDKQLEKEERAIQKKQSQRIQTYRQEKRKELQTKIKAFYSKFRQESGSRYEEMAEKIACQNQIYESKLKQQSEIKIKQYKQSCDLQTKNALKTLQSLMNKEKVQREELNKIKQQRVAIEEEHDELLTNYEYLKKKENDFQAEVVTLKVKDAEFSEYQKSQVNRIAKQWDEQIQIIHNKIAQVDKELETQERVLQQKQEEQKSKYTSIVNNLQKESLQRIKKLKEEIDRARMQKEVKQKMNKNLIEMRKKLNEHTSKRVNH